MEENRPAAAAGTARSLRKLTLVGTDCFDHVETYGTHGGLL
jgi:hypothetical protein